MLKKQASYSLKKRRKKEIKHKSFRLEKPQLKDELANLSILKIAKETHLLIKNYWLYFLIFVIIFFILGLLLGIGIGQDINLDEVITEVETRSLRDKITLEIDNSIKQLGLLIEIFLEFIVSSLGWFIILFIIFAMSSWYLIRELRKDSKKSLNQVRQAVYYGSAQIIPFFMLLILFFLQIFPSLIIADFAVTLRNNGVLDSNLEQLGAVVVVLALMGFSFYWALGGLFSLIIVCLPQTSPWQAWSLSFNLLHRRRSYLFKHVIYLIFIPTIIVSLVCLVSLYLISHNAIYVLFSLILVVGIYLAVYLFVLYDNLLNLNRGRDNES